MLARTGNRVMFSQWCANARHITVVPSTGSEVSRRGSQEEGARGTAAAPVRVRELCASV